MTGRLLPAPSTLAATRAALHAVAEWVLAPARFAAESRIGLRATPNGFGTPPLADGRELRVEGRHLAVESDGALTLTKLTTLADAVAATGGSPGVATGAYEPVTAWMPDAVLDVDATAAQCLAEWFAFTESVLEELRADATDPSEIQLWPEHFDLAMDVAGANTRVNLGGSPGDERHPLPYLYVGPWTFDPNDSFWNEPFGSSLGYDELLAATDQRATALAFLRSGLNHA